LKKEFLLQASLSLRITGIRFTASWEWNDPFSDAAK